MLDSGDLRSEILDHFRRERGTDVSRVQAVVLVHVETAAALISPAYENVTEAEIVERWRDHHLMRTSTDGSDNA